MVTIRRMKDHLPVSSIIVRLLPLLSTPVPSISFYSILLSFHSCNLEREKYSALRELTVGLSI